MSDENIVDLDNYRRVEDIVKRDLGLQHVVIAGVTKEGSFLTYVPLKIQDIELVYIIETLKDRRNERNT